MVGGDRSWRDDVRPAGGADMAAGAHGVPGDRAAPGAGPIDVQPGSSEAGTEEGAGSPADGEGPAPSGLAGSSRTGQEATGEDGSDGRSGAAGKAAEKPDPLTTAITQRDEYLDSLRRLQAEFENYRKRVTSQQAEQAARAAALLVDKLLPVLDTLDLAVQHLGDADSADGKALVASGNQLHSVLAKEGLERIDPLGEVFDPNAHEAVGHVPAEADEEEVDDDAPVPKPVVAQVMRPGYRWKGAVLRPAMVTVRG
jgi:molecular chaperone GrpE